MPMQPHFARLGLAAVLCAAGPASALTVLYDAAAGTPPSDQGWLLGIRGGVAGTQGVAGGVYTLDSTGQGVVYYGNGRSSPLALDTDAGFELVFSLQVLSESHADSNRAGYSVLMVGADRTKAVEIAFWADHVWAYDYVPGAAESFVHGIDAAFDTTAALRTYSLAVGQHQFRLTGGGAILLEGSLRDYSPSGFFPYFVANTLFFGDDTSRGASVTQSGFISLTPAAPVPEPAAAALLLAGLAGLAWRRRAAAAMPPP